MGCALRRVIAGVFRGVCPSRGVATGVVRVAALALAVSIGSDVVFAQSPVLSTVEPSGGAAGQTVLLTLGGGNLQSVRALRCSVPGAQSERVDATHFRLSLPAETLPGFYDLWAVGDQGVSGARSFVVSHRREILETEPNDATPNPGGVDVVINGRIEKPGDLDQYSFEARRGQRVVIECLAERIDSRLRAVLELYDASRRRLAANRGHDGVDPLIDFLAPADGTYTLQLQDLINSGGGEHYYRLEIDAGPRIAFSVPNVIPRGQAARVTLHGWNLPGAIRTSGALDRLDVDIPASQTEPSWPLPFRLKPADLTEGFPLLVPQAARPVLIGLTDIPVATDRDDNHAPATAQEIAIPSEVSGRLTDAGETDWFAVTVRRGEVLHLESFGQRIHSPVDLQLGIHDSTGVHSLARFSDESRNVGGAVRTDHLDPSGRWVAPSDGRYLVAVTNLIGGVDSDPRRSYRLSVRREEPDFQLIAAPHNDPASGLNIPAGGRTTLDLILLRRGGFDGPVRVTASDLPAGIECPDVWFGSGVHRTVAVVSADRNAAGTMSPLKLEGIAEATNAGDGPSATTLRRPVRGATLVRTATPQGGGRLTADILLAVTADAPLRITANAHEPLDHPLYGRLNVRHSPGGIVDVAVQVDRRDVEHRAPVRLIAIGLPEQIRPQATTLTAEESKGYLSLLLPPSIPAGRYSFAIRAETTVPAADKKPVPIAVETNTVTIDVQPAAFLVEVDPFAVSRARRGETIQVSYSAHRINGFIGKMHTELASPGRVTTVVGLRGRGETFTGQTEKGTLQIVVNDDAPLGRSPFLRLLTVGVVEDEPIYMGCSILPLEVIE